MSWPAGSPGDAVVTGVLARWPARPARRASSVLGLLGAFGAAAGWPASAEDLLDYDLIEGFCVRGCARAASSTRGTYRSVLHALAGPVKGPPGRPATPQPGAKAPPPYSRAERADLTAMARGQSGPAKRSSALAMVILGIGAGLRPGELAALRGTDVGQSGRQVTVHAGGTPGREIPVVWQYADAVAGLALRAGDGFVFRPGPADRSYHDFVNGFARRLVADPAGPRLSAGRCRSSFICDHLAAGTPVPVLLAITGIAEAGSLARYARHVGGVSSSKAALRARWRTENRP